MQVPPFQVLWNFKIEIGDSIQQGIPRARSDPPISNSGDHFGQRTAPPWLRIIMYLSVKVHSRRDDQFKRV